MVSNYRPYKEYQDRFKRIEEGYTLICLGVIKSEARRSAEELKTSTQSSESITARRTNDQRGRRVLEWQPCIRRRNLGFCSKRRTENFIKVVGTHWKGAV